MAEMSYEDFLKNKMQLGTNDGFDPVWMPDFLFDFQRDLVEWAVRKGRAAIFADCGLGKTPMQLVWARNITIKTGRKVLIATPLAVGYQTIREGAKFNIDCLRSNDGTPTSSYITITNYENLHKFNPKDFVGVVCDESSILKNFDGKRKAEITEFMRTLPYRLCCTATAAPNDYIELGTTAEALGEMGFMDMLGRFFKNESNSTDYKRKWAGQKSGGGIPKWRFKKHAEIPFWKWVTSWARALRRPSDMGYNDDKFILPPLIEKETMIENEQRFNGSLFVLPAIGLKEQREERRLTINRRCESVAEKVKGNSNAIVWCHLNDEGDLLEELIPDAVQVSGSDSDHRKEEAFIGFSDGKIRILITKPKIGGFGMNWQHCSHLTFFPSHSFEQYYQAVRRCWRFGQTRPVTVDIITSKGEIGVLKNLQRKAKAADEMFTKLVTYMNLGEKIDSLKSFKFKEEVPRWL
jgi:hypothetical protein